MKRRTVFLAALACLFVTIGDALPQVLLDKSGFAPTRLIRQGPAPQTYREIRERPQRKKIEYPSGELRLAGWLASPSKPNDSPVAVVYLHGGYSLSEQDMRDAQPFLDAGYPVLFPALRGENGNPGHFELMRGEVSDAMAAAAWLSQSGGAARPNVVVFGHSIGGGTAELTTLQPSDVVLLSGSSGGLFLPQALQQWEEVPFDRADEEEVMSRTFMTHVHRMKRRHVAYMGESDSGADLLPKFRAYFEQINAPVSAHLVPGDHHSSLKPAIQAFLQEIPKAAGN